MNRWQRLRTWAWSTKGKVVLSIGLALLLGRLALPWALMTVINNRLSNMTGYVGRVLSVDVSLWRGAYTLNDLMIERVEHQSPVPFVMADQIDISVEWMALLHGRVVAELIFEHPVLNFVNGRPEQNGAGNDWRSTVDDIVPITINHLAIHHGEVHYRDFGTRPTVDVVAAALEVEATGLSTVRDEQADTLPAHIDVRGRVMHSGQLHASVDLDPWDEQPTFDLAVALERLRAPELNRFLRAYASVDAEEGEFYCYSEINARHGSFTGYVKPMVEHLSLFHFGEEGDIPHQLADLFVQMVEDLFENHGTDRFATRVEVSGSFAQPGINPIQAVVGVLRNTFIQAFEHGLERRAADWIPDHSRSPVHG